MGLPSWLIPTITTVTTALSAVVLWGFVTGKWVQGREDDHDAIARLRQEFDKRWESDRAEVARLRQDFEKVEQERRMWSERVNVDIGKLQGQAVAEEKLYLVQLQHMDDRVRSLQDELEALAIRFLDMQRQIDQGRRARS